MSESIVNSITQSLTSILPAELIIFIISVMPILELRGGLIAASILGVNWFKAFPICIVGNLLPLPFILLFIDKIFEFLKKTRLKNIIEHFEKKAIAKSAAIEKHRKWGLFVFVAVPLPGTGGWTGALVASCMRMKLKDTILPISLGVLSAGVIMSIISYVLPMLFV